MQHWVIAWIGLLATAVMILWIGRIPNPPIDLDKLTYEEACEKATRP